MHETQWFKEDPHAEAEQNAAFKKPKARRSIRRKSPNDLVE